MRAFTAHLAHWSAPENRKKYMVVTVTNHEFKSCYHETTNCPLSPRMFRTFSDRFNDFKTVTDIGITNLLDRCGVHIDGIVHVIKKKHR